MTPGTTATSWAVAAALVSAPSPTVVLATPELELSPQHEGWRSALNEEILAGAERAGLHVGPAPRCATATCAAEAAQTASVPYVVSLRVVETEAQHQIDVRAVQVSSGDVVARLEASCELCGYTELSTTIGDQLVRMSRELSRVEQKPSALSVRSRPSDATVSVDGAVVGRSPLQWTVEGGHHVLDLERSGYLPTRIEVEAMRGDPLVLDIPLERDRARLQRRVGWALIGLGVASVAAGSVLIALDETDVRSRCSGPDVDPAGNCRLRHNTLAGGIGMSVAGAVGLGTGVGLLIHGIRRRRQRSER